MADFASLLINQERLMADVHALAAIGVHEGERTRSSYSPEYQAAADWLIARMEEAGLETRVDVVGNVIGRMGSSEGAVIMTGSHIDTVRNGGPLDGAYGVLAGIEIARVISENNIELKSPYEVVAFVDEEGVYLSLFGSMAMAGKLTDKDIEIATDRRGIALADAMKAQGFDASKYKEAAYPEGSISKFIELHIEQGPVLENLELDIGVVDGIVCQHNVNYTFHGYSNHAGTTPMDMRKDALRAASDFITRTYDLLETCSSPTTRLTFGAITVEPNASNVIPREAVVRLDARDLAEDENKSLIKKIADLAHEVAENHSLKVSVDEKFFNPAALMADDLINVIQSAANELGYSNQIMPSGAGHDAQALALVCDAGMIFVPSNGGLSHHPDEWTEPHLLGKGANVLLQSLLRCVVESQRAEALSEVDQSIEPELA